MDVEQIVPDLHIVIASQFDMSRILTASAEDASLNQHRVVIAVQSDGTGKSPVPPDVGSSHSVAFKVTSGNADRVAAVDHERGIGAVFITES